MAPDLRRVRAEAQTNSTGRIRYPFPVDWFQSSSAKLVVRAFPIRSQSFVVRVEMHKLGPLLLDELPKLAILSLLHRQLKVAWKRTRLFLSDTITSSAFSTFPPAALSTDSTSIAPDEPPLGLVERGLPGDAVGEGRERVGLGVDWD